MRLFEFMDLAWFPESMRGAETDYLRFMWEAGAYKPIVPRLKAALVEIGSEQVLDLASGGGGPVVAIYKELIRIGCEVRITLSDRFPNLAAFKSTQERTEGAIQFVEEPVDATAVPAHLEGFRTLFGSLHHFPPGIVRRMLGDAVAQRRPIGIFDATAKTPPPLSMALLGNPLAMLLAMPWVRPFRWRRLLWTYVIPVVPLCFTWDAVVSGLRLYSVDELRGIVEGLSPNDYQWDIGAEGFPRSITYLVGRPGD